MGVIKEEPLEIMDQGDSMGFQAPGGSLKSSPTSTMVPDGKNNSQKLNISALPDGDFESQIDSDQETVAFGETPEKNRDDEIKRMENCNSRKNEEEKGLYKLDKKRLNENSDDKDRNKRKREYSHT